MAKRLGKRTIQFSQPPAVLSSAAIAGEKEGQGPLGKFFDEISQDSHFGQKSWELAESEMQKRTIALAVKKAGLRPPRTSAPQSGSTASRSPTAGSVRPPRSGRQPPPAPPSSRIKARTCAFPMRFSVKWSIWASKMPTIWGRRWPRLM